MSVEVPTHCNACGELLQYKWFRVDLGVDEVNLGGFRSGSFGICRPCFLKAMGVEPNGKPTDAEEVREVSTGKRKPVRTRRTPVTRADIDSYRRSAGADRSRKKKAADRASGKQVSEGSGEGGWESLKVRSDEHGELPPTKERETDGTDDKEM